MIFYKRKVNLTKIREVSYAVKNNLMTIRKKNKLNQDQLASEMEVSRQTISSLENGRYNPSILLAMKLARFFHVTVEDIFIYEEDTQHDNIN